MVAFPATEVLADLSRPARHLVATATQTIRHANEVTVPEWGASLTDLARRLPGFLRAGVVQMLACHAAPAALGHGGPSSVMLVPGLFCTPSVLNRLGLALDGLGYDVHLPRSFPYFYGLLANTGPVERSVAILLNDLEHLAVRQGVREVTLVGHSLGGIIALAATAKAKSTRRRLPHIRGVVLLASPIEGTPLTGLLSLLVPACRDIQPGAATLNYVRAAAGDVLRIISAGSDSLVPRGSQEAVCADTVCFPEFQHMDFYLGSQESIARTARAIADVLPAPTIGA